MSLYAIGDIHGCFTALTTLFAQNIITPEDEVVFLGDYVDRGPDSKKVINWLLEKQETFHFHFILGNHDIMMREARTSSRKLKDWTAFGGDNTLSSYGSGTIQEQLEKIPLSHWTFIDECLPYLEIGPFIFVHAGLEPDTPLHQQDERHLFWKKYEEPVPFDPDKVVICGHTSRKNGEIADFGHTICIDTYAYGGKWLTCLNVETGQFLKANEKGQIQHGKLSRFANRK